MIAAVFIPESSLSCLGQKFSCSPFLVCLPMQNKSRLPQKKPQASCSFVHQQPSGSLGNGLLLPPLEETVEALTEFLRSPGCPWALPADCSPEDQQLRELAVRSPQLIQDSFIFLYFKSLRIVNKGVSDPRDMSGSVDEDEDCRAMSWKPGGCSRKPGGQTGSQTSPAEGHLVAEHIGRLQQSRG